MKFISKSILGLAVATLIMVAADRVNASEWDSTGFVGLESRVFWLDPRYPKQAGGAGFSVLLQPEIYWRSSDDRQRLSVVGFARADSQDSNRSHVDLREAYWGYEGDSYDWIAGINRVFWGVTESRHLVDVINQTDLVEDIDQEDKLGQPMLNLNIQRDYGRFGLFIMPWFRERTFPGVDGRFRTPLPVDTHNPIYESSAEQHHTDLALRYDHYFGDIDIGVNVFRGTSREPRFVVSPEGDRLLPAYDQMTQAGLDVQYTRDAWLWKLEAIARESRGNSFAAAVGGFEYTFYGVRGGAGDVGLLLEYLYDGRGPDSPPTVFGNDLFFGARFALNDANDTSVLAGITADLDSGEMFFNVEAERRIGESLGLEMRLRAFSNAEPGGLLYSFERDNYFQLRLNWYY
jgi:hypothetical protein